MRAGARAEIGRTFNRTRQMRPDWQSILQRRQVADIRRASGTLHQVRPSLPLFPFPSASVSGDAVFRVAGSPSDTPEASSRSGSASGGASDESSSPAAAEAEAASDQRPSRNSYLPCFRPFRNSVRIEGGLIGAYRLE